MQSETFSLIGIDDAKLREIGLSIKEGKVAVIPTDTIYAISGSALLPKTVEKIYNFRRRTSSKPMIILIESTGQIKDLGIELTADQTQLLFKLWPNPLSVVVDTPLKKLHYLHRGKKSLAFRMPDNEFLLKLLKITGPLVAPSANFEGEAPALNIEDAKKYFKDSVLIYLDAGDLKSKPSTVAKLEKSGLKILREGAFKIPKEYL